MRVFMYMDLDVYECIGPRACPNNWGSMFSPNLDRGCRERQKKEPIKPKSRFWLIVEKKCLSVCACVAEKKSSWSEWLGPGWPGTSAPRGCMWRSGGSPPPSPGSPVPAAAPGLLGICVALYSWSLRTPARCLKAVGCWPVWAINPPPPP